MVKYNYDPAKAKALFDETGMTEDKRKKTQVDLITYPGLKPRVEYFSVMQEALRALGFQVNVDVVDNALWSDTRNGKGPRGTDFDLALANLGPGRDPFYLEQWMRKDSDLNFALSYWPSPSDPTNPKRATWRWSNARAEELWDLARKETDAAKLTAYLQEIDCIYNQDPGFLPITAAKNVGAKSARLQGLDFATMSASGLPLMVKPGDWWLWEQK